MSDVGGTAGLILGISFATIVGLIDICMQYVVRMIWAPFGKVILLIKSLDWEKLMNYDLLFMNQYNFNITQFILEPIKL